MGGGPPLAGPRVGAGLAGGGFGLGRCSGTSNRSYLSRATNTASREGKPMEGVKMSEQLRQLTASADRAGERGAEKSDSGFR